MRVEVMGVSGWEGLPAGAIPHIGWSKSHLYHLNPVILLDPGPPTGEKTGGCGERGGHLSVFWGPARVLPGTRLAYFSRLLDVVQEEKPRARTRRWPEEEAPSIGGSDGRDGHEGSFRRPSAGILSAGHRLADRKCPMDDHPGCENTKAKT